MGNPKINQELETDVRKKDRQGQQEWNNEPT